MPVFIFYVSPLFTGTKIKSQNDKNVQIFQSLFISVYMSCKLKTIWLTKTSQIIKFPRFKNESTNSGKIFFDLTSSINFKFRNTSPVSNLNFGYKKELYAV